MNMSRLFEILREHTGNMVTEYGFYIPLENYHFTFWKDLVIYTFVSMLIIFYIKYRVLKNRIQKIQEKNEVIIPGPGINAYDERTPAGSLSTGRQTTPSIFINSGTDEKQVVKIIRKAMDNFDRLFLLYSDINGRTSERIVRPIELMVMQRAWYLKGFCFLRKEERTFKLSRIIEIRIASDPGADIGSAECSQDVFR